MNLLNDLVKTTIHEVIPSTFIVTTRVLDNYAWLAYLENSDDLLKIPTPAIFIVEKTYSEPNPQSELCCLDLQQFSQTIFLLLQDSDGVYVEFDTAPTGNSFTTTTPEKFFVGQPLHSSLKQYTVVSVVGNTVTLDSLFAANTVSIYSDLKMDCYLRMKAVKDKFTEWDAINFLDGYQIHRDKLISATALNPLNNAISGNRSDMWSASLSLTFDYFEDA